MSNLIRARQRQSSSPESSGLAYLVLASPRNCTARRHVAWHCSAKAELGGASQCVGTAVHRRTPLIIAKAKHFITIHSDRHLKNFIAVAWQFRARLFQATAKHGST